MYSEHVRKEGMIHVDAIDFVEHPDRNFSHIRLWAELNSSRCHGTDGRSVRSHLVACVNRIGSQSWGVFLFGRIRLLPGKETGQSQKARLDEKKRLTQIAVANRRIV